MPQVTLDTLANSGYQAKRVGQAKSRQAKSRQGLAPLKTQYVPLPPLPPLPPFPVPAG
jgi:hypothetical protein